MSHFMLTWTSLWKEERHGNVACRKIIGRGCYWSRPIMERSLSGRGRFSRALRRSHLCRTRCARLHHADAPECGRGCHPGERGYHPPIPRLTQVSLHTQSSTVLWTRYPGYCSIPGSLHGAQAPEQELRCNRGCSRYHFPGSLPVHFFDRVRPGVPERSLRGSHHRCTTC